MREFTFDSAPVRYVLFSFLPSNCERVVSTAVKRTRVII